MLIVHLFVSYAHVNLCHFFFPSSYQGLAAASPCGSSRSFLFTFIDVIIAVIIVIISRCISWTHGTNLIFIIISSCSLVCCNPAKNPRGRAMCFFLPCDIWWLSVGLCLGCEQLRDCLIGSGMGPSRFAIRQIVVFVQIIVFA